MKCTLPQLHNPRR